MRDIRPRKSGLIQPIAVQCAMVLLFVLEAVLAARVGIRCPL